VPRPLHILVALDWVRSRPGRLGMERACRAAAWPVVLRRDGATAATPGEAASALRRATRESLDLLRAGRVLVVFPEGYPNVDPGYTPKPDETAFLPFQPGFVRLASLAAGHGRPVPIVPAGFSYAGGRRWRVALRFGEPFVVAGRAQEEAIRREVEESVRRLSAPV
jgi:putative membrane protein